MIWKKNWILEFKKIWKLVNSGWKILCPQIQSTGCPSQKRSSFKGIFMPKNCKGKNLCNSLTYHVTFHTIVPFVNWITISAITILILVYYSKVNSCISNLTSHNDQVCITASNSILSCLFCSKSSCLNQAATRSKIYLTLMMR